MKTENSNLKPTTKNNKSIKTYVLIGATVTLCIFGGFLGGWLGAGQKYKHDFEESRVAKQIVASDQKLISEIVNKVGPSVVSVNVVNELTTRDIFGRTGVIQNKSAGTGFIISESGYVVTNRHVVPEEATKVVITLSDGTELDDIEVIGQTAQNDPLDIAFLKIKDKKGKNLVPAVLADSSKVEVGESVVAIGNALGQFQNTVTSGIISGYGRNIDAFDEKNSSESLQNLFQTDAAINQGNSGGPLVNMNGEVIGINVAVAGNAQGIGFAIPINDVKGLIKSVLEKGKLERGYLGVRYVMLTDDIASKYGLSVKRGAFIIPAEDSLEPSIVPGSPAAIAGLKEGDVITKINGIDINEDNSLTSVLGQYAAGDEVTITIIRDKNQEITVKARLKAQ